MISETILLEKFSKELNYYLNDRNMTQKELAKEARLSEAIVNDYAHGRKLPGARAIINMSHVLDVGIGELIDFGQMIE